MIFDGEPKDFNQDALDGIYGGIESPEEDGDDSAKQASQDQEASA